MDRTRVQPGWIVLIAALSEVVTAAPACADAGLFEFNSAWLSEQSTAINPSMLDNARRLRLDGFQAGSVRLGLDIQKAAPPPDPLRALRYTVKDARKDWLRSLSASQPRRLSLTGTVDQGAARGLSFQLTRNDSAVDTALESRLSFERSGFSADVRLRNVGGHFARSALVGDDEWNSIKDIVGWKQTDMRFRWKATPALSLASEITKGTRADSGESRNRRRLSLDWKSGSNSHLSLYHEATTSGRANATSRATKRGFAWNQSVSGFAIGVTQDEVAARGARRDSKRIVSLATPDKGPAKLTYRRTDSKKSGRSTTVQALTLQAKPARSMKIAADYSLTSGADSRNNKGLQLGWSPGERWKFDGRWRDDSDASGAMLDMHLTGTPSDDLNVDARSRRITDPKDPLRREDAVTLKQKERHGMQWSARYARLQTKKGRSATVLEADAKVKTSLGLVTAAWRDGDADVLPGYSDVAFESAGGKAKALSLKGHMRLREQAPDTQAVDLSWKANERLTVSAAYARNPEDKNGAVQRLDRRRVAIAYAVTDRLHLDVSRSVQGSSSGRTEATDLSLKGRLDEFTTVDFGVAIHNVPSLPTAAAYHVDIERTVDDDNRFKLAVDRQTRAVNKKDDLTASVQLVSTF